MRKCSVEPYEGTENYIFVSYCHKDKPQVYPIIEQLARDGYRIWYDDGIHPGTEWPEIIASHLNNCALCMAFISDNAMNSHDCRREINFALLKKKPFISITLEKVEVSLGMEMQISLTQNIHKYEIEDDNIFFSKIYKSEGLAECFDKPNSSIIVSKPEDYIENDEQAKDESGDGFSNKWFIGDNKTIVLEESKEVQINSWLIRNSNNEKIDLSQERFKIGRSDSMCDYAIKGNAAISRHHATIIAEKNNHYLVDNNSVNYTFLNAKLLEPHTKYILSSGDVIRLANETFTYYQEMKN